MGPERGQSLVDVLDRILERGLVVAGDIRVNLADVELLTIQVRLLVCSVDKAEAIGLDWWKTDPRLSRAGRDGEAGADLPGSLASIEERLNDVQRRLDALDHGRAEEVPSEEEEEEEEDRSEEDQQEPSEGGTDAR